MPPTSNRLPNSSSNSTAVNKRSLNTHRTNKRFEQPVQTAYTHGQTARHG
jgi:hypothetical protein